MYRHFAISNHMEGNKGHPNMCPNCKEIFFYTENSQNISNVQMFKFLRTRKIIKVRKKSEESFKYYLFNIKRDVPI